MVNGFETSNKEYTMLEKFSDYAVMKSKDGQKKVFEFKDRPSLRWVEKRKKSKDSRE